jgi:hypothetical protein
MHALPYSGSPNAPPVCDQQEVDRSMLQRQRCSHSSALAAQHFLCPMTEAVPARWDCIAALPRRVRAPPRAIDRPLIYTATAAHCHHVERMIAHARAASVLTACSKCPHGAGERALMCGISALMCGISACEHQKSFLARGCSATCNQQAVDQCASANWADHI